MITQLVLAFRFIATLKQNPQARMDYLKANPVEVVVNFEVFDRMENEQS